MSLCSGEFYGMSPPEANLELLARFFENNPEYTDKAFLSVKVNLTLLSNGTRLSTLSVIQGALAPGLKPDSS